jgi:hypothetical protein
MSLELRMCCHEVTYGHAYSEISVGFMTLWSLLTRIFESIFARRRERDDTSAELHGVDGRG